MSIIQEAQDKINRILEELEIATGFTVEDVSLDRLDVTSMDSGEQHIVGVRIEMRRPPGQSWERGQ